MGRGLHVTQFGLLLALALALVAAADVKTSRRELNQVHSAISGGYPAEPRRYHWMASLRYASFTAFHYCGASLIHKRVVMTAAHCVLDDHNAWSELDFVYPEVRIGGYEYTGGEYEARKAVAVLAHEGYDSKVINNDVALILLDRDSSKTPIKLPPSLPSPAVPEGTLLHAIGWGATSDKQDTPYVLQETTSYALSIETCQLDFQDVLYNENWNTNSVMCAATAPGAAYMEGTCSGDSGGPLFVKATAGKGGRRGQDMQVGIVSWGIPAGEGCHSKYPSGFTDVAYMRKWIDAGIKKLLNGTAASAAAASRPSPAVAAANAGRTDTMRKLGFTRPRAHVPKFPGAAAAAATISYPCNLRLGSSGCRRCDASGSECLECGPGWAQVNGKCKQCKGGDKCMACGVDLACQACTRRHSLGPGGSCYVCEALNCFQCNQSAGVCSKCLDEDNYGGFWWQKAQRECRECSTGCLRCSNSTTCLRCADGLALVNGRCVRCTDPRCGACPNGPSACTTCRAAGYRINAAKRRRVSNLETLRAASLDDLAAALTEQLGPAVLGDLEDERCEWQRLADLLSSASGIRVGWQQAEGFFSPAFPGSPGMPDFLALHRAGLYPSVWPLPLEPAAVAAAQARQHAAQRRPGGLPSRVGAAVEVFWPGDCEWSFAVMRGCSPSNGTLHIHYPDSDQSQMDVDPAKDPIKLIPSAAAATPGSMARGKDDILRDITQMLGKPLGSPLAGKTLHNLEALAAAGCYPQRWGVPLTAAGVAAANAAAAAEPAQPPASKPGAAVAATQRANSAAAAAQRRRGGGPQASSQQTIGMKESVFAALAGRAAQAPLDWLPVVTHSAGPAAAAAAAAAAGGAEAAGRERRSFTFSYTSYGNQRDAKLARYLGGRDLAAWVTYSGARVGDVLALKRLAGTVLVRHIPAAQGPGRTSAAQAAAQAAAGAAAQAGATAERGRRESLEWVEHDDSDFEERSFEAAAPSPAAPAAAQAMLVDSPAPAAAGGWPAAGLGVKWEQEAEQPASGGKAAAEHRQQPRGSKRQPEARAAHAGSLSAASTAAAKRRRQQHARQQPAQQQVQLPSLAQRLQQLLLSNQQQAAAQVQAAAAAQQPKQDMQQAKGVQHQQQAHQQQQQQPKPEMQQAKGVQHQQQAHQQQQQPQPKQEPQQHSYGAASVRRADAGAAGSAAPTTAQPGSVGALAQPGQAAARQLEEKAAAAFAAASTAGKPNLSALQMAAVAGYGGDELEGILEEWEELPSDTRQLLFAAALRAASQGAWGSLEKRLRAAQAALAAGL
ncbi:Serine ase stubble isoform C [Micractinium conductrix]|uniref:Serine ase stubble isoform C n=1 Tax=Micractinium conductrix TaxID=554055 RepID=A0A2P6VBV6_9CHLO|nr:Serine ase stubble isoform C [Micractinium conductrix]|eukprot:PSC71541.1 Serine ase stubble isoform C [Micractinium conductrix]